MKNNSISKNAFWNICSRLCNLLMVFFCTPLIIRNLGEVTYGIYVILGTIGGILSVASLGMGEATLKYVSQHIATDEREEVQKVFTSTLILYTLLGGGIALFLCLFPELFVHFLKIDEVAGARLLFRITALTFWVHLVNSCFTAIPQAVQRYEFCTYVGIVQNLFQLVVVFLVVKFGYGIIGLMYVTLFNAVLMMAVNWGIAKYLLPYIGFRWPGRQGFRKVFNYGVMIFGSQVVGLFWQYSDNIILTAFIGPQAVSYFSVPMQIVGKGFGLIASGSAVLFPKFSSLSSNMQGNKEKIADIYVSSTQIGLLASIALCVPLAVLLPDFLRLWISSEFSEKAAQVATILAVSYIVRGAFLPYESLLKGLGLPKYVFLITLSSSLIITLGDLICIPLLGLNGVGFSYVISSSIGIITIVLIFRKLLNIPMKIFWKDIFVPYFWSLISVAVLILFRYRVVQIDLSLVMFLGMSSLVFFANIAFVAGFSKLTGTQLRLKR